MRKLHQQSTAYAEMGKSFFGGGMSNRRAFSIAVSGREGICQNSDHPSQIHIGNSGIHTRGTYSEKPRSLLDSALAEKTQGGIDRNDAGVRAGKFASAAIYAKFRGEIAAFSSLPPGWDSYQAKAPSPIAVETATDFIDMAERHQFKIEWVAPTTDDSVMVTLETATGRQEWDFYSDGDIAVTILDISGKKHFLDVKPTDVVGVLLGMYGIV